MSTDTAAAAAASVVVPIGIDLGSLNARIAVGSVEKVEQNQKSTSVTTSSSALPSVVSNSQGGRYILALVTEEESRGGDGNFDDGTSNGENGTTKGEKQQETMYIYGEAARRSLHRNKIDTKHCFVRHICRKITVDGDDDDSKENGDNNNIKNEEEASSSFFSHMATLACDASSSRPSELRAVISVPSSSDDDDDLLTRGLIQAVDGGLEMAMGSTESAAEKKRRKKMEKKIKEDGDGIGVLRVMGVLTDAAAVCVAHGLSDVNDHANCNRIQLYHKDQDVKNVKSAPSATFTPPTNWKNTLVINWGASGLTLSHVTRPSTTSHLLTTSHTQTSPPLCSGHSILQTLVKHCASQFERKNRMPSGCVMENKKARRKLEVACGDAIRTLGRTGNAVVAVDGLLEGVDANVAVSRPRFDMLCGPVLRKAGELILEMKGRLEGEEDFDVVLTSGSVALMPSVVNLMAKSFPNAWRGRPDLPVDEAVVVGCARWASILVSSSSLLPSPIQTLVSDHGQGPILKDVTLCPISLGVQRLDDHAQEESNQRTRTTIPLVQKGTPLPANVARIIELLPPPPHPPPPSQNGHSSTPVTLGIVQTFEDDDDQDDTLIAKLDGIDPEQSSLELVLDLAVDGTLTVALDGQDGIVV